MLHFVLTDFKEGDHGVNQKREGEKKALMFGMDEGKGTHLVV